MPTPREQQVERFLASRAADLDRARADTARQKRREAKCALVGHHDMTIDPAGGGTIECQRCGRVTDEWEDDA